MGTAVEPPPPAPPGFEVLGLRAELTTALGELGYEEPTPIQREAIPPLLAGRDLLGQAATGTGKTAAFALPLLDRLAGDPGTPCALVLVPTRELAVQVAEAVRRYGRHLGVSVLPIYGGQAIGHQLRALDRGVAVVVATPGRALDHLARGTLDLSGVRVVVLDEADEMLDMGFAEDIDAILAEAPPERQTLLFSATLPKRILSIADAHLADPVRITIRDEPVPRGEPARVRHTAYVVPRPHKLAALARLLDLEQPAAALVFCRTRTEVDEVTEALNARGYRADALHGGMTQDRRDRVLRKLRGGGTEIVVATDVAARGLDIEQLSHVVNHDLPASPDGYVHRVGRVGRAGREGVAITLAEPREHRMLKNIERALGRKIAVASVPTVADLRLRRLELLQHRLREELEAGGLEEYRAVAESLAGEFDVVEVVMAAIKVADAATRGEEHEELPEVPHPRPRRERRGVPEGVTRIFVGVGREAGVRPEDLVGAIANEAGLSGREIGAIEIADRFSLVEVPEPAANGVIQALRRTTIKGRRPTVKRDRRST